MHNKIQKAAIRKRIIENMAGGSDFNDSSTSSNVIPQINVVKTRPITAKEYVLKIIFFLIHVNCAIQQQYHSHLLILL